MTDDSSITRRVQCLRAEMKKVSDVQMKLTLSVLSENDLLQWWLFI